jgi:ABC-type branched-subunit amino acid transport system substrate-binding protein
MLRKRAAAAFVASVMLVAACGGDDEPSTTDAPAAATTAPATEETEPATEETEPATEETEPATEETEPATEETEPPAAEGFAVDTSACEDPDAANAVIEGDIKIGTSIPLSGGPAALFAPYGDGFQAYFDYFAATEGDLNGQALVPIIKDDQYTADLTKTNVDELIFDEEVAFISGVIGSPNNAAIIEDMNAQCIPQLWASTGAPTWGAVDVFPWTTGLLVPYAVETKAWLEFVKAENPDAATAALFFVNNEFGQAYADAFRAQVADYGIEIVAEETIDAADSGAPSGQLTNIAAANPDIVLAVPLGAQCIGFLGELGNVKAANPDFAPLVYQTATCANPLFFIPGGAGADGVYTSANLVDVNNPDNAELPEVTTYIEAFTSVKPDGNPGGIAVAGWLAAELTVATLQAAAEDCPDGITRACIINAARNLDYKPSLFRGDLSAVMGPTDGYIAEGTQMTKWNATDQVFEDVGEIINVEGTTGVYTPA